MPREWLIQHRAGTLAEWAAAEASGPVLLAGERAYITDLKLDVVGDGVAKVASLGAVGSGTYAAFPAAAPVVGQALVATNSTNPPALGWGTSGRLYGPRTMAVGDSITAVVGGPELPGDGNNHYVNSNSWFFLSCALSGQRIRYVANQAVSGSNSGQVLSGLTANVVNRAPDRCIILAGSNDYGDGLTVSQTRSNLTAIYDALEAAGIMPIMCSILPRTGIPSASIAGINQWIAEQAYARGVPFLDFYSLFTDASTGNPATGYTADGIHPTALGQRTIAAYVVEKLAPYYPPATAPLPYHNGETTNLVTNGLFLTDADSNGRADNWATGIGSLGSYTTHTLTSVSGWAGSAQTITRTATDVGAYQMSQNITTGWSPGDTIALMGRTSLSVETGAANASIYVIFGGHSPSKTVRPIHSAQTDLADGVFYVEHVIPIGTTTITVYFGFTTTGYGTLKFGQLAVRNLTTLAVA